MVIISITGNIGCGKSTVIRALKTQLQSDDIWYVEERISVWNYDNILTRFYDDQKTHAYELQTRIMQDYIKLWNEAKNHKITVVERGLIDCVMIFARIAMDTGGITQEQYDEWLTIVDDYVPDITIYLRVSPLECMNRIKIRNRRGESSSIEYLNLLDNAYNDTMAQSANVVTLTNMTSVDNTISICRSIVYDQLISLSKRDNSTYSLELRNEYNS